jgi:hypothetical protein
MAIEPVGPSPTFCGLRATRRAALMGRGPERRPDPDALRSASCVRVERIRSVISGVSSLNRYGGGRCGGF